VIWSAEAETDPAMCGRATLAMVWSSTVMIMASMIEISTMVRLGVGSSMVVSAVAVVTALRPPAA